VASGAIFCTDSILFLALDLVSYASLTAMISPSLCGQHQDDWLPATRVTG